jgi:anthranilate synthase component 1
MLTLAEVEALAKQGNVIPLTKDLLADTETPVSVYCKLARQEPYSFLLESVEGGEKLARYSFIGYSPFLRYHAKNGVCHLVHSGGIKEPQTGKPLEVLRNLFRRYQPVPVEGLPVFSGGAVGFFGYDAARLVENIPRNGQDDLAMDDVLFGFYDLVVVFDNLKHKVKIVSNVILEPGANPGRAYEKAKARIAAAERIIGEPLKILPPKASIVSNPVSNMTPEEYQEKVRKCKEYILAGDAFQIVLSQRLCVETGADPFDVYRNLRILNPSPYMYFLKMDRTYIAGASPEVLVRVQNGRIIVRPIAGTRPRGQTPEEDLRLEKELLADPKERAEHLMLVDLGRNDVGRVAEFGSVQPSEFMVVERYSHVMHIVSQVEGRQRPDLDALQVFFSCFPAGTLSGAPKIRAMEIIDELEPTCRSTYGGAIGYIDFGGNLDSCITIRTMLVKNGKAYIQAGAGIVADSDPAAEYQETLNKAGALLKAINMLKKG